MELSKVRKSGQLPPSSPEPHIVDFDQDANKSLAAKMGLRGGDDAKRNSHT